LQDLLAALPGFFKQQRQFGLHVLATPRCLLASAKAAVHPALTAKEGFEKVAEVGMPVTSLEIRARLPARRRRETSTTIGTTHGLELVVLTALVLVLENFVGLGHFLELLLGVSFLADVRVVFACQALVRLFDFL